VFHAVVAAGQREKQREEQRKENQGDWHAQGKEVSGSQKENKKGYSFLVLF